MIARVWKVSDLSSFFHRRGGHSVHNFADAGIILPTIGLELIIIPVERDLN